MQTFGRQKTFKFLLPMHCNWKHKVKEYSRHGKYGGQYTLALQVHNIKQLVVETMALIKIQLTLNGFPNIEV